MDICWCGVYVWVYAVYGHIEGLLKQLILCWCDAARITDINLVCCKMSEFPKKSIL